MNVYVSGVAARAALVEQDCVTYIDAEWPDTPRVTPLSSLANLFMNAPDVVRIDCKTLDDALPKLLELWSRDRSLRMLQVALDPDNEDEESNALTYLDRLLQEPEIDAWVRNFVLSVPNPQKLEKAHTKAKALRLKRADALVGLLVEAQPAINEVRRAWDAIDPTIFGSLTEVASFEKAAVERGVFADLALARIGKKQTNVAMLEAYANLRGFRNAREIIRTWEANLGLPRKQSKIDFLELGEEEREEEYELDIAPAGRSPSTHAQITAVRRAQAGIIDRLSRGDLANAKRFAAELVADQLKNGGAIFASKTLCNLGQQAKLFGLLPLALEWTQKATEIVPTDGWAHGQMGDTLLRMHRVNEAFEAYSAAIRNGEDYFGLSGIARTYRASYRLHEAIEAFRDVIDGFPDHADAHFAWLGIGEALRELGKFEDAVAHYQAAKERFPEEAAVWCGWANSLKDVGRLQEAKLALEQICERFQSYPFARASLADTFSKLGDYERALSEYESLVLKFPDEAMGYTGVADSLVALGRTNEAVELLTKVVAQFPHDPNAYCRLAETHRARGDMGSALDQYDEALRLFPYEPHVRNGRASTLRDIGDLKASLQAYDDAIRNIPFDPIARIARAHLLRELALYEEALVAFDHALALQPHYRPTAYHKAAVLAILGRYSEADKLLPSHRPQGRAEWIAEHVRGMMLLKQGKVVEAVSLFEQGVKEVEYAHEREYFSSALALAYLRKQEYVRARERANASNGIVANIVALHTAVTLRKIDEATKALGALEGDPRPVVIELRSELSLRLRSSHGKGKHDDNWLLQKETEAALALAA